MIFSQSFFKVTSDINAAQGEQRYIPLYVKQEMWEKDETDLKQFDDIIKLFSLPYGRLVFG